MAGYNGENKDFSLFGREAGFDRFFVFDLTSETSAKDCYYQINVTTSAPLDCHEMKGTRTGTAAPMPTSRRGEERRRSA